MYEIKNNVNGKIYVGVHKTAAIEDGYFGSGKILKAAIKKYGIENFTKTILEEFETQEAMYEREKEFVNDEFLLRSDTYNLRRGGLGGFDHLNDGSDEHIERTKRGNKKLLEIMRREKKGPFSGKNNFTKDTQSMGNLPENREKAKMTQRKTFEENGHQQGFKNSQFGSCWITDGTVNKKQNKNFPIPNGWRRGRI